MAHHPSGRWAYLVNQHDGSLIAYAINSERGTLSELGRDTILPDDFSGGPRGAQIHVSADGRLSSTALCCGGRWHSEPEASRSSMGSRPSHSLVRRNAKGLHEIRISE